MPEGLEVGSVATGIRGILAAATAVLFTFVLVLQASAAVNNSPQRDTAAISTMQSAITALGGSGVVAGIQDCILTGSILNSDGTTAAFNWTIAGREFRRELDFANGGNTVFYSGHGTPAWTRNGTNSALRFHMIRANPPLYLPPYILYQELNNAIFTLKYVGAVQLNGKNAIQIHVSDDSDVVGTIVTPQEWYFDPVSFLPLQVQFRQPTNENAADFVNATFVFSQFGTITGILVPSVISYSQDDAPTKTITINSIVFNSGVPPGVFDPPQGGGQ